MAEFKRYVIEFKLYDGTTRQVPIEIPLGEKGGYYQPNVEVIGNELIFSFTPSEPDMTPLEPVKVDILTKYATTEWANDKFQVKGDYATTDQIPEKPEDIGADPKGTAANAVYSHNTSEESHGDMRIELKAINDRLNAFFNSDDKTLDELAEIVGYITNNNSLIEGVTVSKVNVTDIVNNLETNVPNRPLSAAQGVVLKKMIDEIPDNQTAAEIPAFDLGAMGMEAVTLPYGSSSIEADTADLTAALGKGAVRFAIPANMDGNTISFTVDMHGFTDGTGSYQCVASAMLNTAITIMVVVTNDGIQVAVVPLAMAIGFPTATEADNGKFMQVVDGAWAAVALQDVSEVCA